MEVALKLECPCRPGFIYKNTTSLSVHKKSRIHQSWETVQDLKKDRIRSKEFENKIARLEHRLAHKEDVEVELLSRIRQLEAELKYYEGVYVN